jgi:very-short-patch-repair endonuclease
MNLKYILIIIMIPTFEKSFASHPKSKFWSNKNKINPMFVFLNSHNNFIFDCNVCNNEFTKRPNDIISSNKWCPFCKNKTELKLFNWLKKHKFIIKTQVKFDWCKNIRHLPYDFVLDEFNIIIELDGRQHFEQVSNWQSPEKTQKNDAFKNKLALENGYKIIRICQEIVWNNKEDWEIELINAINNKNKYIEIGNIYKK